MASELQLRPRRIRGSELLTGRASAVCLLWVYTQGCRLRVHASVLARSVHGRGSRDHCIGPQFSSYALFLMLHPAV